MLTTQNEYVILSILNTNNEERMKQILITLLIAILSASLTANYFLWERAKLSVQPIELAMVE